MDSIALVAAIVALCVALRLSVALYHQITASIKLRPVNGPGFSQYLPNGDVYPIFKDPNSVNRTWFTLSKKHGDVYKVRLGWTHTVISAVPADIVHIMSAGSDFANNRRIISIFENLAPGGLFTMPKEVHLVAKKRLRDNLTSSMLASFHTQMTEAVDDLCHNLTAHAGQHDGDKESRPVDISKYVSMATLRGITNIAFGFNMDAEERLKLGETMDTLFDEMMKDFVGYPVRQALTRAGLVTGLLDCKRKVDAMCRRFIQKRINETQAQRERRHRDLLDVILELPNSNLVSATSLALEFALAGSHTTSQAVVWSVYETCCNPHVVLEIERELSAVVGNRSLSEAVTIADMDKLGYVKKVWKETLRLRPPSSGVIREASRDVVLKGSGTLIPKGSLAFAFAGRAQTHPKLWRDADAFKPERWGVGLDGRASDTVLAGMYLPFSVGPRGCPGRFLADYEGPLILAELHRRFRFELACAPDEVVSCSAVVETAKYASVKGGPLDMGLPLRIHVR